jgi:hypothetical protein
MHKYYLTDFLKMKKLENFCRVILLNEAINSPEAALFQF